MTSIDGRQGRRAKSAGTEDPSAQLRELAREQRDANLFDPEIREIFDRYVATLEESEVKAYEQSKDEDGHIDRPAQSEEFDDASQTGETGFEDDASMQQLLRRIKSKKFIGGIKAELAGADQGKIQRDVTNAIKVLRDVDARMAKMTVEQRRAVNDAFLKGINEPDGFKNLLKAKNEMAVLSALDINNQTVAGIEEVVEKQLKAETPDNLNLSRGMARVGATLDVVTGIAAFGATQAGASKYIGAGLRNSSNFYEKLVHLADQVNIQVPYLIDGTAGSGTQIVNYGTNAAGALLAYVIVRGVIKNAKHLYQDTAREHMVGNSMLLTAVSTPFVAAARHPGRFVIGAGALSLAAGGGALSVTHSLISGTRAPDDAKIAEGKMTPKRAEIAGAKTAAESTVKTDVGTYARLLLLVESKGLAGLTGEDAQLAAAKGWIFKDPLKPTGELNLGEGPIWAAKRFFMQGSAAAAPTPPQKTQAAPVPAKQAKGAPKNAPAAVPARPAAATGTKEVPAEMQTSILAALEKLARKHEFTEEEVNQVKAGRWEAYVGLRALKALVPAEQQIAKRDKDATEVVANLAGSSVAWTVAKDFSVIFATSGNEVPDAFRLIDSATNDYRTTFDKFNDTIGIELTKEFSEAMKELNLPAGDFKLTLPKISKTKEETAEAALKTERTPYPHEFTDADWKYLGKAFGDEKKFETTEARSWYLAKANLIYGLLDFGSTIPAALIGIWMARRLREEMPENLDKLNKSVDDFSSELCLYINSRVLPALRLVTGMQVPIVSRDAMKDRLRNLAEQEVSALTPERKRTRGQKIAQSLTRLFQISAPETAEKEYAFFDWFLENREKMASSKNPLAPGDFLSRLYPEFGTFFVALAKYEQKGNAQELDKIKLTGMEGARRLARTLMSEEIDMQSGKAAAAELALARIYSQTDNHPILGPYKEGGFGKTLDGKSNVVLLDIEARRFMVAARMEQLRGFALQRLNRILSESTDPEVRDARAILAADRGEVAASAEGRDPRKIIERVRIDLGDEAAQVVDDVEKFTWQTLFGAETGNMSLVNQQLSEINRSAVKEIETTAAEQSLANPLQYLPNATPEFSFAYSEKWHRPTLFVGLTNKQTGVSLARVAYPGYIPNPSMDGAQVSRNIVDWYTSNGQYELGAYALNAQISDELAGLRQSLAEALTTDGATFDVVETAPKITESQLSNLARVNVLSAVAARQDIALSGISRYTPISREQLNPFFEESSVLIGKSGVIESADIIRQKFDRVVKAHNDAPQGQKPKILYNIATGMLDIDANGARQSISLQDFVSL